MPKKRRLGSADSETRAALLDATERVMVEDGYAAVTSRRVAQEIGVTPALVHYYFPTIDDLFFGVVHRRGEEQGGRLERLLKSTQPLRALWELRSDPSGAVLLGEFLALANHRKEIGKELRKYAERFRRIELGFLAERLEEYGVDPKEFPPEAVLVLIESVSRGLVQERSIGMRTGLKQTHELVERLIERLEGPPAARRR